MQCMIQNVYNTQSKDSVTFSISSLLRFDTFSSLLLNLHSGVHSNSSLAVQFCSFTKQNCRRCVRLVGPPQSYSLQNTRRRNATKYLFLAYIFKPRQRRLMSPRQRGSQY